MPFLPRHIEPHWRRPALYRAGEVPRELRPWLLDPDSLTRRVIRACGAGGFAVRVVAQGRERPRGCEREALAMGEGETALIRQVQLTCAGTPWIFARSVIPQGSLRGANRHLARLGERPLGAVLFADPSMIREPVEIARIVPGSPLFAAATAGIRGDVRGDVRGEIWGRRSVFRLRGLPLLVSELFLPGVPQWGCAK